MAILHWHSPFSCVFNFLCSSISLVSNLFSPHLPLQYLLFFLFVSYQSWRNRTLPSHKVCDYFFCFSFYTIWTLICLFKRFVFGLVNHLRGKEKSCLKDLSSISDLPSILFVLVIVLVGLFLSDCSCPIIGLVTYLVINFKTSKLVIVLVRFLISQS